MTHRTTEDGSRARGSGLRRGPLGQPRRQEDSIRAIEVADFPFEHISRIAELESWRKEINRPNYHIHKWWAQRLGSVFRAIVIGAFAHRDADVLELFYSRAEPSDRVVFDPFMGSGTTIGEVLKIGGRAIGRDINPVAHFLVKNAVSMSKRSDILRTFHAIEADVAPVIQRFYRTRLDDGREAAVLYYFWVQQVACPSCERLVDLFDSYVFARHAYPDRYSEARVLCPKCHALNRAPYNSRNVECTSCHGEFDPASGPVTGRKATCPQCGNAFPIIKASQRTGLPPTHRQYAKLILMPDGEKVYSPTNSFDLELYSRAGEQLERNGGAFHLGKIKPGYNTNQILNYCYTEWQHLFNARQLLCLGVLANRIKLIPDEGLRELFCCLFSGVLEFNNMFASFKGEGTGAVRHMFSHHILKPERKPLEANPWGTPKSSGSFSTLFKTRILRALEYCERPFEIRVVQKGVRLSTEKILGLSEPLVGSSVAKSFAEFSDNGRVYLSCGDSRHTDLPPESVDAVITDPPFFDNVHYSELADFFYGWQRYILPSTGAYEPDSSRRDGEVQQTDARVFSDRLTAVWVECHRVLKSSGLLVFTYHHSRLEGWRSILASLRSAGFCVVAAHPVKSEMSVATPKHQSRQPIDIDMILVCRKQPATDIATRETLQSVVERADNAAEAQILRLRGVKKSLSQSDMRVIFMAQVVAILSRVADQTVMFDLFDNIQAEAGAFIARMEAV